MTLAVLVYILAAIFVAILVFNLCINLSFTPMDTGVALLTAVAVAVFWPVSLIVVVGTYAYDYFTSRR